MRQEAQMDDQYHTGTNEEMKVYQKQELKRVQDSKPKDTLQM